MFGPLYQKINQRTTSRTKLVFFKAIMLTVEAILSIVAFNLVRLNIFGDTYKLPLAVGSDVFRYHFYVDIVPGLVIFTQVQFSSFIKHELLDRAKRNFTYGEASIVAHLASSATATWALVVYTRLTGGGPFTISLTSDIVLNVGLAMFFLTLAPAYLFIRNRATLTRYSLIAAGVVVSYCSAKLLIAKYRSQGPISWLINHIFATPQTISLFSFWLSTVAACLGFSTSWSRMVGHTNSLVRKVFHLAICVVFISGLNQDVDFMRFAAGSMLIVMSLVETVRAWQLWPMGDYLENICRSLRGRWDNRYLTLSQIYLLVGAFLPLWLIPDKSNPSKLATSSGLISVGVGDTAAAVFGTFFGRHKLGNTGKTVEGFLGNLIAMIAFKLIWMGYNGFNENMSFLLASFSVAVVEALTENCDNLILPLVFMLVIDLI